MIGVERSHCGENINQDFVQMSGPDPESVDHRDIMQARPCVGVIVSLTMWLLQRAFFRKVAQHSAKSLYWILTTIMAMEVSIHLDGRKLQYVTDCSSPGNFLL